MCVHVQENILQRNIKCMQVNVIAPPHPTSFLWASKRFVRYAVDPGRYCAPNPPTPQSKDKKDSWTKMHNSRGGRHTVGQLLKCQQDDAVSLRAFDIRGILQSVGRSATNVCNLVDICKEKLWTRGGHHRGIIALPPATSA